MPLIKSSRTLRVAATLVALSVFAAITMAVPAYSQSGSIGGKIGGQKAKAKKKVYRAKPKRKVKAKPKPRPKSKKIPGVIIKKVRKKTGSGSLRSYAQGTWNIKGRTRGARYAYKFVGSKAYLIKNGKIDLNGSYKIIGGRIRLYFGLTYNIWCRKINTDRMHCSYRTWHGEAVRQ